MFNTEIRGYKEGRYREDTDTTLELPDLSSVRTYAKPKAELFIAELDDTGKTDVSARLQDVLDEAGKTGGVVYIPGGLYRLDSPVTVPGGVELRGTSSVPTRDLKSTWNGTVLLSYYRGSGDVAKDAALITLNGKNAGMNGLRIVYPENFPHDGDLSTSYAVRGKADGVYVVNCSIAAASHGVDFADCDYHFIDSLLNICYKNGMYLGGKNGVVINSLANQNMLTRCALPAVKELGSDARVLEEVDYAYFKDYTDYIVIDGASGELLNNIFMFCPRTFVTNKNSDNTTVVNCDTDDFYYDQFVMDGGSMTVVNAFRSGGNSFNHIKGLLKIYNRFEHAASSGIKGDSIEESYVKQK